MTFGQDNLDSSDNQREVQFLLIYFGKFGFDLGLTPPAKLATFLSKEHDVLSAVHLISSKDNFYTNISHLFGLISIQMCVKTYAAVEFLRLIHKK